MQKKVFLVGLPGTGKTTLGVPLATHLGVCFVDLDQNIEKKTKTTIAQLFNKKGEAYFRELEHIQLKKIIEDMPAFVLATGGGAPCFFNNMDLMKTAGTVIFIDTPIPTIKDRLKHDQSRPLMKANTLENLLKKRKKWYEQADHTVESYEELIALF